MDDWTEGYVSELEYLAGYFRELNPLHLRMVLLLSGYQAPKFDAVCELGFGQGLSINFHGAGYPTASYWGTDFNPAQAVFARELAAASGDHIHLFDQSFTEFFSRADLPEFDNISLHGVWSWINDDNRKAIVDFIRNKTKPGGVVYISYNVLSGFADFQPLRSLLYDYSKHACPATQPVSQRIASSFEFADKLMALNPLFARLHPGAMARLKKIKGQDHHYLAHEYFNADWHPANFSEIAKDLGSAKLSYACSADIHGKLPFLNLTPEQQEFLAGISDSGMRETVLDMLWNQQFRKDIWIKGPRRLGTQQKAELLRNTPIVLMRPKADVVLTISGRLGEATLQADTYHPILEALDQLGVTTIGELENSLKGKTANFEALIQAITVLMAKGDIAPAQIGEDLHRARSCTKRLNQYLLRSYQGAAGVKYLVSPVTASGIDLTRIEQLLVVALDKGCETIDGCVDYVWSVFEVINERMTKNGSPLLTEDENKKELNRLATDFMDKRYKVFQRLELI